MIVRQAAALIGLRATLWKRRLVQERQWGRLLMGIAGLAMGALLSVTLSLGILAYTRELRRHPEQVAQQGGALALFASWLAAVLVARVWFAFLPRGQTVFLDPRRFLVFAVPSRLVSALNFAAQLFDPSWLFFWPILVAVAVGAAGLPGMAGAPALLAAEALSVWAVAGVLHLAAAVAGALDSKLVLRRVFSVVLGLAAVAGFQLAIARPGRPGLPALALGDHWRIIAFTPPGWAAVLAQALSDHRVLDALAPALLLVLLGAASAVGAHKLSVREALRPPESGSAPGSARRAAGWKLPFAGDAVSALLEKEAKTVVRAGWLQLVLVPVGFLMLRAFLLDPRGASWIERRPLLFAAVYAHLGVLELATNVFGRDLGGARGWLLWPVQARTLFAAKNLVAYAFSLCIFAGLVLVARATGPVTAAQLGVALAAHLATFPILAILGNVASVLWPVPVRGMRLRRVRGSGPLGARFAALAAIGVAAGAPWAVSKLSGLPLGAAYLGEAAAMAVAYGGLLALSAHLFEARREPLLAALAKDE